ncbi:efflux transporter outer membrane subunit [Desulfobulbus elongatus]|uniref:efflux transporter outer membrane subunit n=1 Tax=Desulfobulbus elongatus TaxID=53332 RepID=UPI00048331FE|nr:efflux transporter outer membrane subunit [Desulfobulbus elongatus]
MQRIQRIPIVLSLMLSLCGGLVGCSTLAPSYNRPAAPVPTSWQKDAGVPGEPAASGQQDAADIPWQDFYLNPRLRKVIAMGLVHNRDLRVAALNVERAQAQYRIQRSELVPKVDAEGAGNFQRQPADFSSSGEAEKIHQYTVGLGVTSYELDLFGRLRSLKDQALEEYLATGQAQRSARISLIAQIAAADLTLAADRELLQLAEETMKTQEESYRLIQKRFELGASSELELREAQTQVESARVDVARFSTQVAQDEDSLNLLVGAQVPADLLPASLTDEVATLEGITPGLSSEILLRRPDVLQAENVLKGYNANIGAARAAYFPRIVLVGSLGSGSKELSGLFSTGSGSWAFAPSIDLPIFDAGARAAQLQVAEIDRDIAIAQYEKAIQTAFREVADTLVQRGNVERQLAAQQALREATEKRYLLARERYAKGVDSHLAVLDAQRSLYSAQQGVVGVRLTRLTNLVSLYKALGGGVKTEN